MPSSAMFPPDATLPPSQYHQPQKPPDKKPPKPVSKHGSGLEAIEVIEDDDEEVLVDEFDGQCSRTCPDNHVSITRWRCQKTCRASSLASVASTGQSSDLADDSLMQLKCLTDNVAVNSSKSDPEQCRVVGLRQQGQVASELDGSRHRAKEAAAMQRLSRRPASSSSDDRLSDLPRRDRKSPAASKVASGTSDKAASPTGLKVPLLSCATTPPFRWPSPFVAPPAGVGGAPAASPILNPYPPPPSPLHHWGLPPPPPNPIVGPPPNLNGAAANNTPQQPPYNPYGPIPMGYQLARDPLTGQILLIPTSGEATLVSKPCNCLFHVVIFFLHTHIFILDKGKFLFMRTIPTNVVDISGDGIRTL